MPPNLNGLRILVVEDEELIAMLLETALQDAGCEIVGPCYRLSEALLVAGRDHFDAALLDVNLAGEKVYPVAELLTDRGIPFVLLSGYGEQATPPGRQDWPTHGKPFSIDDLLLTLSRLVV